MLVFLVGQTRGVLEQPSPATLLLTASHIALPHYTTGWRLYSVAMFGTRTASGSLVVVPISLSHITTMETTRKG